MFKLMKYEFRKQLFSKILILIVLAVLEAIFLFGLFTDNDGALKMSMGLFAFTSFAAVLFVMFESIFTFSNDLKTKQSYMLFLTPNSAYKIIGAKILSSVIYVFMTAAALVTMTLLNIGIIFMKYDDLAMFADGLRKIFNSFLKADINTALIITILLYLLFDLIGLMVIGMASITLSATFLSNSKGKAVVSIVFFFGINYLMNKLEDLLPTIDYITVQPFIYRCILSAAVMVVFYVATAWMLDKKVSV